MTKPMTADNSISPETAELLPCPFCGETRISLNEPNQYHQFGSINCPACMMLMPGAVKDQNELINCWNGRALTGGDAQPPTEPVDITGWKLVPDQPTEAMWQAGRSADIHPGDSYSKVWSAMFDAAPDVDDCETTSSLSSTEDKSHVRTFSQCEQCWQPAACKKYGCRELSPASPHSSTPRGGEA